MGMPSLGATLEAFEEIETVATASAPSAGELREAFRLFNDATSRFSETYRALQERVRQLDLRLALSNAELQRSLEEKERVKDCLAAILASLPVGIVVVDSGMVVRTINSAAREILGVCEMDILGRPLEDLLDGLGGHAEIVEILGQGGRAPRSLSIVLHGVGEIRREVEVVVLSASPAQRETFGGVLAFHDVTQLKRSEQRTATVSRLAAMGEMAMNVAHEIRNPLGSIELFASTLSQDLVESPRQRQLAEFISAGVRSIESIVENILQFNRPRRLVRKPHDLRDIAREALRYAEHLFQQRGVELVWEGGDAPLLVSVDRELLKQVFLNLGMNAAQAMEAGGSLEIRARASGGAAVIEFLDQGPGIPASLLPRIFDPFVTTRPKGTGLGLTIAHTIVTAHGGIMEISNRPEGGARASIELPLNAPSGSGADASAKEA